MKYSGLGFAIAHPALYTHQVNFIRSLRDDKEAVISQMRNKIEKSIVLISTSKVYALASHVLIINAIFFKVDC